MKETTTTKIKNLFGTYDPTNNSNINEQEWNDFIDKITPSFIDCFKKYEIFLKELNKKLLYPDILVFYLLTTQDVANSFLPLNHSLRSALNEIVSNSALHLCYSSKMANQLIEGILSSLSDDSMMN
jgi:hypothetical protein